MRRHLSVEGGGCDNNQRPSDHTWGRGTRPVVNIDWRDAQSYVAWLNRMTYGNSYRLLSEAEWEYGARSVTTIDARHPAYPWREEIGEGRANCDGCGNLLDGKQTTPVGSFDPNPFGLFDTRGNVWQWVEDCYRNNLDGAPVDGSPWKAVCEGEESSRVVRGGSWYRHPNDLRSAHREGILPVTRSNDVGFRVARTL
jgi:formylglycine-generating enzyme required for sulfatase activity